MNLSEIASYCLLLDNINISLLYKKILARKQIKPGPVCIQRSRE